MNKLRWNHKNKCWVDEETNQIKWWFGKNRPKQSDIY